MALQAIEALSKMNIMAFHNTQDDSVWVPACDSQAAKAIEEAVESSVLLPREVYDLRVYKTVSGMTVEG